MPVSCDSGKANEHHPSLNPTIMLFLKLSEHSLDFALLILILPGVHPLVSSFINPCGFALSIVPTLVSRVLLSRNMMSTYLQSFLKLPFIYHVPSCHFLCCHCSEFLLFSSSELRKPKYSVSLFPMHNAVVYLLYLSCIFAFTLYL